MPWLLHGVIVLALTVLTQIGGLAWVAACLMRRRIWGRLLAFLGLYATISLATPWIAPYGGRVALDCLDRGPLQVQHWLYCAFNRHYVSPGLAETLDRAARAVARAHPGTVTLVLDGNFPFLDGFPLLPHLSHDDGNKADLAFYYTEGGNYLPGQTRSPIGYFAFEDGPTECPKRWLTLRWNFTALQPLWPEYGLDAPRMRTLMEALAAEPDVGKIFIEPHLVESLGLAHPKVRFQGCRAARHDDHIHMQLR